MALTDYILLAAGPLALIVYTVIKTIFTNRYHARRAEELGCKPALQRPYRWPLGADMAWQLMKADRDQMVPEVVIDIVRGLDVGTWEQNFLGIPNFTTTDPKNIQAILATQFDDFALGEQRRGQLFPLLGNGIFTNDGKAWEHSRALLRPQFARHQISNLELEETHVQDLFRHLTISPSASGWTDPVDLSPLFFRLTLDSATEFLFGESVQSQLAALPGHQLSEKQANEKLDWTRFGPAFDSATMAVGVRGRLAGMYYLYSPPAFYSHCREVRRFADYYVRRALSTPTDSLSSVEKGDKYVFLTELVKSTRDPIELRSQLLHILLAGRDTTAGLLGYTFYLLARHAEIYAKLRQIVLDSFGPYSSDTSRITFASLKSCSYLQHVLLETLRLHPSVPLNSRRCVRDTTLPRGGGPDESSPVYVRKGTEVNYTVHAMHHRKDLWGEDADEFKPSRFEGRKTGWEFLPFNGGPRICLGQQFALTEAGYVTVRLVQRFAEVLPVPGKGEEKGLRHQYSVTASPATAWVKMREETV